MHSILGSFDTGVISLGFQSDMWWVAAVLSHALAWFKGRVTPGPHQMQRTFQSDIHNSHELVKLSHRFFIMYCISFTRVLEFVVGRRLIGMIIPISKSLVVDAKNIGPPHANA